MPFSNEIRDREFDKFRQNLRGSTTVRIVDSANYYGILTVLLKQIYTNNELATRTIEFFDFTSGHYYNVINNDEIERTISVIKTEAGYIINPNGVFPEEEFRILQENGFSILLENGDDLLQDIGG
jgi:hypothetical protein